MTKEELEKEAEEKAKEFSEHPLKEFCKFPLHWTDFDKAKGSCYMNGYFAGAEPREKRIEDLERKLEQTEKDLTDYQFNYPKIKDLEKENAELKKENAELRYQLNKNPCVVIPEWHCKDCLDWLIKAKNTIKAFLLIAKVEHLKDRYETVDEAEQFLKEIDK